MNLHGSVRSGRLGEPSRNGLIAFQIRSFHNPDRHHFAAGDLSHNTLVRSHNAKIKFLSGGNEYHPFPNDDKDCYIVKFTGYRQLLYLATKRLFLPGVRKIWIASDFDSVT